MFENVNLLKPHRRHQLMPIFFALVLSSCLAPQIWSRQISLEQAIEIAVNKTPRGYIIRGRSEVAEQNYRAKKINFYVPEISINGSLPAYSVDESYRFFGGSSQKELYKTKELSFRTFVELKQSLITGGALTITANLTDNDDQYPDTRRLDLSGNPITGDAFVSEKSRRGFFDFRLTQPLFRPSSAKHDLDVRKANKEIAAFARIQEQAGLEKDVTTAYLDLLQAKLKASIYADKLESARLKAGIDSSKFSDGVVSEEELLTSTSAMLDAELERFEFQTAWRDQKRELALLLAMDDQEALELTEPPISDHLTASEKQQMEASWQSSTDILKARIELKRAEKIASFSAAAFGIQGDITAGYSLGRGKVETEYSDSQIDDDINTAGWTVGLNVRVPVFDGGASSAEVKAAWFEADQSRLEYQRTEKQVRAQIVNLINKLDVSYRRLDIISKQIGLADNRLKIADQRYQDGQISKLTYLVSRIFYVETQDKYLQELEAYLLNKIEIESKFPG